MSDIQFLTNYINLFLIYKVNKAILLYFCCILFHMYVVYVFCTYCLHCIPVISFSTWNSTFIIQHLFDFIFHQISVWPISLICFSEWNTHSNIIHWTNIKTNITTGIFLFYPNVQQIISYFLFPWWWHRTHPNKKSRPTLELAVTHTHTSTHTNAHTFPFRVDLCIFVKRWIP